MSIYEWLKQFSITERCELANEIGCTTSYLNYLVSKRAHCSIKLGANVYQSNFNRKLPKALRWTEEDYVAFRNQKLISRGIPL